MSMPYLYLLAPIRSGQQWNFWSGKCSCTPENCKSQHPLQYPHCSNTLLVYPMQRLSLPPSHQLFQCQYQYIASSYLAPSYSHYSIACSMHPKMCFHSSHPMQPMQCSPPSCNFPSTDNSILFLPTYLPPSSLHLAKGIANIFCSEEEHQTPWVK